MLNDNPVVANSKAHAATPRSSLFLRIIDEPLCNGQGVCACESCHCYSGWTRTACDCSTFTSGCIDPENSEGLCNDHGDCVCGKCRCREDQDRKYVGTYCQRYQRNETFINDD
ncbi:hypothetical protein M0802_000913 [Mischocyttarus mexicanus]|nr:hypothetical protein M0802_000913 [Mischocyttarus mexicanus]